MERETGIEPVTSSLGSWRSTAELLPLICQVPRRARDFACGLIRPQTGSTWEAGVLPLKYSRSAWLDYHPSEIRGSTLRLGGAALLQGAWARQRSVEPRPASARIC